MYRYVISRRHTFYTVLDFNDLQRICQSTSEQKVLKLITDAPTLYRDFQYVYELRVVYDDSGVHFFDCTPSAVEMAAQLLYIRKYVHFDTTLVQLIAYRQLLPLPYQNYMFDRIVPHISCVPRAIPLFDGHSGVIQTRIKDGYDLDRLFIF